MFKTYYNYNFQNKIRNEIEKEKLKIEKQKLQFEKEKMEVERLQKLTDTQLLNLFQNTDKFIELDYGYEIRNSIGRLLLKTEDLRKESNPEHERIKRECYLRGISLSR